LRAELLLVSREGAEQGRPQGWLSSCTELLVGCFAPDKTRPKGSTHDSSTGLAEVEGQGLERRVRPRGGRGESRKKLLRFGSGAGGEAGRPAASGNAEQPLVELLGGGRGASF